MLQLGWHFAETKDVTIQNKLLGCLLEDMFDFQLPNTGLLDSLDSRVKHYVVINVKHYVVINGVALPTSMVMSHMWTLWSSGGMEQKGIKFQFF